MGRLTKNFLIVIVSFFIATGCQEQSKERIYKEVVIKPSGETPPFAVDSSMGVGALAAAPDTSEARVDFSWSVPNTWEELPGGGMRLVSFRSMKSPDAIDVSIVSLSGQAGGLEANLIRWAGQLNIDLQSDQSKLSNFINAAQSLQANNDLTLKIYDFRSVQESGDGSTKSMVAAMTIIDGSTVFIKMTGSQQAIEENFDSFKALAQSLRKK